MKIKYLLKIILFLVLFSSFETASSQTAIFNYSMSVVPYGIVNSPGYEAFGNIIDNNINTKFLDFTSDDGMGFTVNLGAVEKIASSISITTAGDVPGRDPKNYEIFGSNDGSNFTSIATGEIDFIITRNCTRQYYFLNSNSYKYYRVNFTNTWEPIGMMQLAEVQLYTCETANRGSISANQTISGAVSSTPYEETNLNSGSSSLVCPLIHHYQDGGGSMDMPIDNPTPAHTAAQSFKTSENVTLTSIKIDVASVISNGKYLLRIFQGDGLSGTELSNQVVYISNSGTNTFVLNSTLAITANQSYTFKLESFDGYAQFYWTNSGDSAYPNGSGYVDGNNNNSDFNFQLVYQNNVNWQNISLSGYTGGILKWQMATDPSFSTSIDIASTSDTLAPYLVGDISQTMYFRAVIVGCSTVFSDYATISLIPSITPASDVIITNITATTADVSWTNGNGNYRAVFIAQTTTGNPSPVDGRSMLYPSDSFGNGSQIGSSGWYEVYDSDFSSNPNLTITGLSGDMTYRVMVVEYNRNDGFSWCTTTNSTNPVNFTTTADASLSNLTLSSGSLSSSFSKTNFNYTNPVVNSVSTISVTPTAVDPAATIKVNGATVSSGSASGNIPLNIGDNTITIVVTSSDGLTILTTTVTVKRDDVAPVFSYSVPNSYYQNTLISSLSPTNTLGIVGTPGTNYQYTIASGFQVTSPHGLATDLSGNIYLADAESNAIVKILASDGSKVTLNNSFNYPCGVAVDVTGTIYIAGYNDNSVWKMNSDGSNKTQIGAGFNHPQGVAVDAAGNVYVADSGNNMVKKILTDNSIQILGGSYTFNGPVGIGLDATGTIYVADNLDGTIQKIPSAGGAPTTLATLSKISYLTVDPNGKVYATDFGNTVYAIATNGSSSVVGSGFSNSCGIALDASDNIFVSDWGSGNVTKIATKSGYYVTPSLPTGLSLNATTGIISGTPTVVSSATNYTISAYNYYGSGTATFNLKILGCPESVVPAIGDGSLAAPYQIASFENLLWISENNTVWGQNFIQTADIDASFTSKTSCFNSGLGWSPIGNFPHDANWNYTDHSFSGIYNGQGYTISNLTINRPTEERVGLFGRVGKGSSGLVTDVHLINVNINAMDVTGAVVGQLLSKVEKSSATGTITSAYSSAFSVGGIAGQMESGSEISLSYANVTISATGIGSNNFGGLCGSNGGTISNCYSLGSVTANSNVGGFVGNNTRGIITNCFSTASVVAATSGGGLVGINRVEDSNGEPWAPSFISGTINNSFWDITLSGLNSSDGGTAKSTLEMKTGSTFTNSGWDFSTTWSIQHHNNSGYPYLIANTINPPNMKTWTGAISTIWNNSGNWLTNTVPTSSSDVIIEAAANQPILTTDGSINTLTIDSGASLTVQTGRNLTVTNYIHNSGTLTIANNANLIQVDDVTNTGNAIVKRNSSSLFLSDYTLWSSPVMGQNLLDFSPLTVAKRFYDYDSAYGVNGAYSTIANPSTTAFSVGKGYLIRMPNNANATTATAYPGVFTGVLNNGDIPVTLTSGDVNHSYNLVGNPYPSPITISTFLTDNSSSIESTLYFWRKTNGIGTAYCTVNNETFVTNNNSKSADPKGIIQTGQGFFVVAKPSATSLTFKNGQRAANTVGQFFKTKQVTTASRIWLNAISATGSFSQMALNYTQEATLEKDDFDGKYINDNAFALTSNINNEEYTIQGRPIFEPSDVVALNFKTDVAGDYTIALDHSDGVFALGQDVYLADAKTGSETNLKTDAYTFTAATGTDNSRFTLKYQKTLKVDAPSFNENTVTIYKNNGILQVKSGINAISTIKVFDLDGRLIAQQNQVNANSSTIENLRANEQVLIIQVTSEDNKVVNKKVIN